MSDVESLYLHLKISDLPVLARTLNMSPSKLLEMTNTTGGPINLQLKEDTIKSVFEQNHKKSRTRPPKKSASKTRSIPKQRRSGSSKKLKVKWGSPQKSPPAKNRKKTSDQCMVTKRCSVRLNRLKEKCSKSDADMTEAGAAESSPPKPTSPTESQTSSRPSAHKENGVQNNFEDERNNTNSKIVNQNLEVVVSNPAMFSPDKNKRKKSRVSPKPEKRLKNVSTTSPAIASQESGVIMSESSVTFNNLIENANTFDDSTSFPENGDIRNSHKDILLSSSAANSGTVGNDSLTECIIRLVEEAHTFMQELGPEARLFYDKARQRLLVVTPSKQGL